MGNLSADKLLVCLHEFGLDFSETAETNSSPRPLSPSMSTNKETPSRKQANQHQAPNTLSMGRRNASRSSAQRCQATAIKRP
ncbi:hypothetical protein TNCV_5060621 [Trichonephila clavipes]|nr:hypothetical protein TNCV_5060621 [Trichonephila clavipes]